MSSGWLRQNLIYRKSARNFNQDMAKAAKYVVAEVEELVEDGTLEAENIHTSSIFVGKFNQMRLWFPTKQKSQLSDWQTLKTRLLVMTL